MSTKKYTDDSLKNSKTIIDTTCYGFNSLMFGLDALTSNDDDAVQLREKYNLLQEDVVLLTDVIVQAPMMNAEKMFKAFSQIMSTKFNFVWNMFFLYKVFYCGSNSKVFSAPLINKL